MINSFVCAIDSLIVGIITYFVAGVLVMKFYKKASGTDLIPNKGFWIAAPLLVKVYSTGHCGYARKTILIANTKLLLAGWICFHLWSMRSSCKRESSY